MAGPIRKSAVAGTWYPGDRASIAAEVEQYLAAARVPPAPGHLVALICPHAGLRYSGPVAAHAYGLLRGESDLTAVLVGPSHRMAFDGVAVVAQGAFETPLGQAPVDEELAARLLSCDKRIADEPRPHRSEHSLEMQLPFLQHLVPGLRIVPVLMGSQSREEADLLAHALGAALEGRGALLIASSDLSHYHPAPEARSATLVAFSALALYARTWWRGAEVVGLGASTVAVLVWMNSFGQEGRFSDACLIALPVAALYLLSLVVRGLVRGQALGSPDLAVHL